MEHVIWDNATPISYASYWWNVAYMLDIFGLVHARWNVENEVPADLNPDTLVFD